MFLRDRSTSRVAAALTLAVAACSTSLSLPCPQPASGACPSLDGVTTFCTWAEWGCPPEPACGGYVGVVNETADARFTYYYAAPSGAFVATVAEAPGGGSPSCAAGPSTFEVPSGCAFETLASCAPPPRASDAGPTVPLDAAADAPFTAPSPSGSPSTQPLAIPPVPRFERLR